MSRSHVRIPQLNQVHYYEYGRFSVFYRFSAPLIITVVQKVVNDPFLWNLASKISNDKFEK